MVSRIGNRLLELFKFLPIRFKLSLIIGSIVVLVVFIISAFVLHNQKLALMNRMKQVSTVLIQNLSETAKDDLLMGKDAKVQEAVLRLKNTGIAGLRSVAVLNHEGNVVAEFDKKGLPIQLEKKDTLLEIRKFTVLVKPRRFEYYYPIISQLQENSTIKDVFLGLAYLSFSKHATLEPIRKARNIAVATALIITLLSIIGINLIAKKMAHQIQLLSDGAREVGKGNLGVEISVNSKDELGQLAKEFNSMIQQLREKLQLQKFVSKLTVQMIKDNLKTNGKRSQSIKQNVTVLFSDVRNFSTIAEKLDPEKIVKLINIYFDLQTRIIEKNKGIVDKFMGDQIMAVFQGKLMADNTLRSAVQIQREIHKLNQVRASRGQPILEIGIGINYGTAVLGNMGSSDLMDYTVIGDVVNVASRLCSAAKVGQIITSYDVTKNVNGTYPTSELSSISVKGRSKAIQVCEIGYNREILM